MKDEAGNDDVRGAGIEPLLSVRRVDSSADLQTTWIGLQGRRGGLSISWTQHNHVSPSELVSKVHFGIRGGRSIGGKVGGKVVVWLLGASGLIGEGGANDLLHLAGMKINARSELHFACLYFVWAEQGVAVQSGAVSDACEVTHNPLDPDFFRSKQVKSLKFLSKF